MKKLYAVLLSAVLALGMFAGCGSKTNSEEKTDDTLSKVLKQGYITMATSPDFGPYEFQDLNKTGQEAIVGCDVALGYYIAEYLGVDLKIESMDFATCQAATTLGQVDFSISGYGYTEERAETLELSDFYQWAAPDANEQCVIVLKGKGKSFGKVEDFSGKKVAAQNGSLQMNLVTGQLKGATVETITSINDGIMMLINGKIDGLACATDTAQQFCDNYNTIEIADYYFNYESEGSVIIAQKGQTALMTKINEALAKAKKEGKYEQWKQEAVALCTSLGVEVAN